VVFMRPIVLANDSFLVNMDEKFVVRDFYYPHIGQYNHGTHRTIMVGIMDLTNKMFSWIGSPEWQIDQRYEERSLVAKTIGHNPRLKVSIESKDFVSFEHDIFGRIITLKNGGSSRNFRLFSTHYYNLFESKTQNTAIYDPKIKSVIHYKDDVYIQHSSCPVFDQFSMGKAEFGGYQGTYKDCEDDGVLQGNLVDHGSVDSSVGWTLENMRANEPRTVEFMIAVGSSWGETYKLLKIAREEGFQNLLSETDSYWRAWSKSRNISIPKNQNLGLSKKVEDIYYRSLFIMRAHTDCSGGIIASSDTEHLQFSADTYDYVWPRDGAWVAIAFDKAGYSEVSAKFFDFCNRITTESGYWLHKYNSQGYLGSTWHPVPHIQIDETGIVIFAFWQHSLQWDIEHIKKLYHSMVEPAANFLAKWREEDTGLPEPSYDLWEEREGIFTYSSSAVYGGLIGASKIAQALGKENKADIWYEAAQEVKRGILIHLYDEKLGRFIKSIKPRNENLDASLAGVFLFKVLPATDYRVENTMKAVEQGLKVPTHIGGIARYKGDKYFSVDPNILGNPWIITTLFLCQWYIAKGEKEQAINLLEWAANKAYKTGLLPEQVHPHTGGPLSVLPLTWSHSTFALTVLQFLKKFSNKY